VAGHRDRGIAAEPRARRQSAERLRELDMPARVVRRVGTVRLEGELLQHQPARRPSREDTARHMAGSNVNGEDAG
jgi:hypothetical protein